MKDDYSQLLIDVQKKSNILVNSIGDLKFLQEDIKTTTGIAIGFNTLRRLFGFLEKTKPSRNTLNSVSKYIDFNSFSHYKNNQKKFDEWYFQQYLQRILLSKKINKDDIDFINKWLDYNENIVYMGYFLSFHIQKNNLEILDFIFENISFKTISATNFHKFSTILSTSFLNLSEDNYVALYRALIHHNNFRNNIPLTYIDYTHLNSRYLKVLGIIEELGDNNSDLLFVSLMKFYNHFYREEGIIQLDIKKPEDFDGFYIVLKGRYYGYEIMKGEKIRTSIKREIININKGNKSNHFLQEIVPALIIKEEYIFLEELINLFYEDLFVSDRWDANTATAIYLIALANVNWKNSNIKTAKSNLELVNLDKIELGYENYVFLFYYLTTLKISFSENKTLDNKHSYTKIKKIVKITGFTKFVTEANKYLIKKILKMGYIILGVLLFSFSNVLWKKNLRYSNVPFLVTYRAFFTSSISFFIILLFYSIQQLTVLNILKITAGSLFGVIGLFSMLNIIKKESLQWVGIYNLIGIVFTSLYLWLFEKINISETLIGISIIILGFIFYVVSSLKSKIKITLKQHIILLIMSLSFTISALIHWKNLTNQIAPVFIIANQELIVFAVGLGFTLKRNKKVEIIRLIKSQFNNIIMSAVILLALLCNFLGLKIMNPLISGLVFLASPLTTILFSSFFFKEQISIKNWISISIISIGSFIIYLQTS